MLGGLDPILIIQLAKLAPTVGTTIARIPILAEAKTLIDMPPIPIYLSEDITGLCIDTEDKNVDISTDVETNSSGTEASVTQKGLTNSVKINIKAKKDSIGLTLLSALMDVIFDKATSQEYSITYMHGPIIIFRGVVSGYSATQNADDDLLLVTLELSSGAKQPQKPAATPVVSKTTGVLPL